MQSFASSVPCDVHASAADGIPTRKWRPWGVAGEHLRRSCVTRFNPEVSVCHSFDAVRAAIEARGPKVVSTTLIRSFLVASLNFSTLMPGARDCVPPHPCSAYCVVHCAKVIKEEFSSSGLGVRVCCGLSEVESGTALERWVQSCLVRDGVVTVEPFLDIVVEFSAE